MRRVWFVVVLLLVLACSENNMQGLATHGETTEKFIVEFNDPPATRSTVDMDGYRSHVDAVTETVGRSPRHEYTRALNGIAVSLTENQVERVRQLPFVKRVVKERTTQTLLYDSVPLIKADRVWEIEIDGIPLKGSGIVIAVLDSGVDYTHPDLGGCFGQGCKVADGYDLVNDDADPMDDFGHGTHVASIAAGSGILEGVAPEATIYAYKTHKSTGLGDESDILAGIEYALDPNQDGDMSDRVDIMSMSFGGTGTPDDPMDVAVDNAALVGVVSVIAAGNFRGEENILSPGTARSAITVGSTEKSDVLSGFSSHGPVIWGDQSQLKPDIVAPGTAICAALWNTYQDNKKCIDDEHIAIHGTSMATPHVSGVVALMLQAHPTWTPDQIKMALRQTAVDINMLKTEQGFGRINAFEAVTLDEPPPVARVFGGERAGTTSITGTATWDGSGSYRISIGQGKEPLVWNEIFSSDVPVEDGQLFSLDTTAYPDGRYTLLLAVTADTTSSDAAPLIIDNWDDDPEITDPKNQDVYRLGDIIPVQGTIANGYESVRVEYGLSDDPVIPPQSWSDNGVSFELTPGGERTDLVGTFTLSQLGATSDDAYVTLRVVVEYEDRLFVSPVENMYIDPTLAEGWPRKLDFSGRYGGVPLPHIEDLDSDGEHEVLLFVGGSPGVLTARDIHGDLLWEVNTESTILSFETSGIAVLENQGEKSVLFVDSSTRFGQGHSTLYSILADGSTQWSAPLVTSPPNHITAADLDGDDSPEIIVRSTDLVYVFNGSGSELYSWQILDGFGLFCDFDCTDRSVSVGDFDDDADLELVLTSVDVGGTGRETTVLIYNMDGTEVAGWPLLLEEFIAWNSPAVGDIDGDGNHDIIVSGLGAFETETEFGAVYAYDRLGSVLPGWPMIPTHASGPLAFANLLLTDIQKDGLLEIGFGYANSLAGSFNVYLLDHTGTPLAGWPQNISLEDSRNIGGESVLAQDVNGDGVPEIIAGYGHGTNFEGLEATKLRGGVAMWTVDGTVPPKSPRSTEPSIHGLTVGYSNSQGVFLVGHSPEDYDSIAVEAKDRHTLYLWNFPNGISTNTDWRVAGRDNQHTGCFDC